MYYFTFWCKLITKTKMVVDIEKRRSKKLSKPKPVENTSKNLQSFLEIGPVLKEVPLLHKLHDHAYE